MITGGSEIRLKDIKIEKGQNPFGCQYAQFLMLSDNDEKMDLLVIIFDSYLKYGGD